ncbi:MAG: beta-ketoacyl synthase N-terminal-like domain-containing protein, partial [Candidatus Omnitrophota bacterium]
VVTAAALLIKYVGNRIRKIKSEYIDEEDVISAPFESEQNPQQPPQVTPENKEPQLRGVFALPPSARPANQRFVITGTGALSPLGIGTGELWQGLRAGSSGIEDCASRIEAEGFAYGSIPRSFDPFVYLVEKGIVKAETPEKALLKAKEELDLMHAYTLAAVHMALVDAGLIDERMQAPEKTIAVVGLMGGSTHAMLKYYDLFKQGADLPSRSVLQVMSSSLAYELTRLGLKSIKNVVSECEAGILAIVEAIEVLLADDSWDIAVVGGIESNVCQGTPFFWELLKSSGLICTSNITPAGICRVAAKESSPLIPSEGAGFIVLERLSSAQARQKVPLAEITGMSVTNAFNPAEHVFWQDMDGRVAGENMRAALRTAHVPAEENGITAVLPFLTGTIDPISGNFDDVTVARAIQNAFSGLSREVITYSSVPNLGRAGWMVNSVIPAALIASSGIIPLTLLRPEEQHPQVPLHFLQETTEFNRSLREVVVQTLGIYGSHAALVIAPVAQDLQPQPALQERKPAEKEKAELVVTGMGIVSPIGIGPVSGDFWNNLLSSVSGISEWHPRLNRNGDEIKVPTVRKLKGPVPAAQAAGVLPRDYDVAATLIEKGIIGPEEVDLFDPVHLYALLAAYFAVEDAGGEKLEDLYQPQERICVVGTADGATESGLKYYDAVLEGKELPADAMVTVMPVSVGAEVAWRFRFNQGFSMTITSASELGGLTLHQAVEMLQRNKEWKIALVVISDAALSEEYPLLWDMLRQLGVVSTWPGKAEEACRVFQREGYGMVAAEGAIAFVIERTKIVEEQGRDSSIQAEVGATAEEMFQADEPYSPDISGESSARILERVWHRLNGQTKEGSRAKTVFTFHVAGTGADTCARKSYDLLREHCPELEMDISTPMPNTGHFLGPTMGVNFAAQVMSLRTGIIPPILYLSNETVDKRIKGKLPLVMGEPKVIPDAQVDEGFFALGYGYGFFGQGVATGARRYQRIRSLGIIGAGTMGRFIAQEARRHNLPVVITDQNPAVLAAFSRDL